MTEVDRLPGLKGGIGGVPAAGDPAVVYGARFSVDGTIYEVRASRMGVLGQPGEAIFGLFRCASTCTEVTRLAGGYYGTTGESIVKAIPLRHLGTDAASADMTAHPTYSALGTYISGATKLVTGSRTPGDEQNSLHGVAEMTPGEGTGSERSECPSTGGWGGIHYTRPFGPRRREREK